MRITVKPHEIKIIKEEKVNENEYKINKCYFEFSEDYTDDLVKVARFTTSAGTYKQYIIDNECDIPPEVLTEECTCILGVYSYLSENDELKLRFSPKPDRFYITEGSYVENAENSEPITPTDKEQIEQAIVNLDNDKQDKLISGENIKTINGESLLGEGDIEIDQDFVKDDNYVHTDNNYTTDEKDKLAELENYDDTEIKETISEIERDISDLSDSVDNKVDKVQGKGLSTNDYTNEEKSKLASLENYDDSEIRQDISDLEENKADKSEIPDVSNFVTKSVNDLVNYYLKSETYTKTEVNNLIGSIQQLHFEIVEELPSTGESNIIYLVPRSESEESNVYDEYIYANNEWEKIGSTDIDLSNYVTTTQLNTALANYTTTSQLNTLLSAKQDKSTLGQDVTNAFVTGGSWYSSLIPWLNSYCGTKTQEDRNTQSITTLQTDTDYLENIIEQLPKTSVTGADVTLNDIIEAKMSVGVKGNTEQDGTPTPSSPVNIKVATGNNTISISNSDNTESQTYTINLGNITLCGLGDYRDYFYKDEDKWYLYKTVDKKIYNGSQAEGWFKYSTNSFSSGKISSVRKSLCDYYEFKEGKTTATSLLDGEYCYASSTNNNAILIKNANYDDANSFKTWLSTHNITIYYVLETPTTTEITDTTLIEQLNTIKEVMSYAGQTNITSTYETGNAPLFINAEAVSDIEKELDNKVDDVQINGTSIVSNGVANIPKASSSNLGVVKLDTSLGITLSGNEATLSTNPATNDQIRLSSSTYRPITASQVNRATFFGLAQASGDTTQQNQGNTVGTYTDTAKTKIQEMLGIVTLTQAEYDSIAVKSDATIYIIVED